MTLFRWLRAVLAVCLIMPLAWIGPVVPVASSATLSADPTPPPCTVSYQDSTDLNAWCLKYSDSQGFDAVRPTEGTYVAHLNSHTDTTVTIPIPLGGLAFGQPAYQQEVRGTYLRDPATNDRVQTGTIYTDEPACEAGATSCSIIFRHGFYPAGGHDPVWIFPGLGYSYLSENKCCSLGSGEWAIKVVYDDNGAGTPAAGFDVHPASRTPGSFQFVSSSSDSAGGALTQSWSFGDGSTGTGASIVHTYAEPGTFHATLKVTNAAGRSTSVTHDVVVAAPELTTTLAFLDADGHVLPTVSPTIGSTVRVRETVAASANGVGPLHHVAFADAPVTVTPAGILDLGATTPAVPADLTLAPGTSRSFARTATVRAAGVFHLASSVSARDDAGATVGPATAQLSASVAGLQVRITLDPTTIEQPEDADGPKPVPVTATITVKNISDQPVTHVVLRSLQTTPAKAGQVVRITQMSGPVPDPTTGYALPSLAAGETGAPIVAKFVATDDGEIDFAALVTAAGATSTLRGLGQAHLSVKPKYLLKFASKVVHPDGRTLPAGQLIEVRGTVTNLSDTATLHVGPLYPTPAGNAGLMGLAYDGRTQSPYDPTAPPPLILDPGQQRSFTLFVTTAYSDPRTYPDPTGAKVARTGGTHATLTFTPWAEATLDDGSTQIVRTPDVLSTKADITHEVGIDDSIAIPQTNGAILVGAFSAGVIQGIYSAAVNLLWGTVQLVKLPFTSIMAAGRYEAEVWASFTPAERESFAGSTVLTTIAVLRRNLGLGLRNTEELARQIKAATLKSLTQMEDAWQTGDSAETLRAYAAFGSEQIASVAIPIALAKMAKSPAAVAALTRADEAVQAAMKPLLGELAGIKDIEQLGPLLKRILSGTELNPEEITKLYGISADELAELQALATKYKFVLTVRSRHGSSLKWIEEKFAMLKPESLKIKTVSALDTRLGYRRDDIGSLVFRKPPALTTWEASGLGEDALPAYIRDYVRQAGFEPGTGQYYEAVTRVTERSKEWNKWHETYQKWNDQKWLPTTFNYRGNAAQVSTARNQFPKMNGFRLAPINGSETDFVVEMYNYKVGRFVPVTGDIDPIAFTHVDGSPLSAAEHAALLDDLQSSALLQTQHGESATFVDGGVKFVSDQFKPGEAALQIAPGGAPARAVRLNVGRSRWKNPFDYNLQWDGGFVGVGSAPDAAGYPSYLPPATRGAGTSVAAQLSGPLPLPATTTTGPTVGRCDVTYDNATGQPLIMGGDGVISTMSAAPATAPDEADNTRCFTTGPVIPLRVRPTTQLSGTVRAGTLEIPIRQGSGLAPSDVHGDAGTTGFTVGSQVVVGAGTDDAEVRTVVGFGSLILDEPLAHGHRAGEVVIVLRPGAGTAAHSLPRHADPLARSGARIAWWLSTALLMLLFGAGLTVGGTRRRAPTGREG